MNFVLVTATTGEAVMEATPYHNGHGRHAVTLSLIAVDHGCDTLLTLISRPGVIRSPISIARYVIGKVN